MIRVDAAKERRRLNQNKAEGKLVTDGETHGLSGDPTGFKTFLKPRRIPQTCRICRLGDKRHADAQLGDGPSEGVPAATRAADRAVRLSLASCANGLSVLLGPYMVDADFLTTVTGLIMSTYLGLGRLMICRTLFRHRPGPRRRFCLDHLGLRLAHALQGKLPWASGGFRTGCAGRRLHGRQRLNGGKSTPRHCWRFTCALCLGLASSFKPGRAGSSFGLLTVASMLFTGPDPARPGARGNCRSLAQNLVVAGRLAQNPLTGVTGAIAADLVSKLFQ